MGTISTTELEASSIEILPARETMAFINFANVQAINLALAINVGGYHSGAWASANQLVAVVQH
jgi:hypothetical protein